MSDGSPHKPDRPEGPDRPVEGFDASEFIAGFIAEAEEHLGSANTHLLSVEEAAGKGQQTPRQVRELFRSLHTIKGLAAMVGVEPVVDIAHAMESVLREADRAAGRLPAGAVELLLAGVRAIEHRVQALGKRQPVLAAPAKLVDALNALRQSSVERPGTASDTSLAPELWAKLSAAERAQLVQGLSEGRRALVLQFVPTAARASAGLTITSVRERASAVAEIVKVVPQSMAATEDAPGGLAFALVLLTTTTDAAIADATATTADGLVPIALLTPAAPSVPDDEPGEPLADEDPQHRGVVRVAVTRLDEALERLSALVVTQFRLLRSVAAMRSAGVDVRALSQVIAENGRQLRDLRGSIMRARMVPVAELLERIPLIVRGLSRSTGKDARLAMTTGKAELDKAVA
ncbi:MAG: chemotaxis protein, partial [Myxococcales bacterium]|nr:chemotaxis protein [Myxococcales bacterium]